VPRLKKRIEQSSSLARVICNYEETGPSWQEVWQYEGWSLAICMSIAGSLEWRLPFRERIEDEDYTNAFLKLLANPDEDFTVWGRYIASNRLAMKSSTDSRLLIWTLEDRAILVSNPLKLLDDGSFFIFDPLSGLYRTDEKFSKELDEIASSRNFFMLDPDAFSSDSHTVITYPAAAFTDEELAACLRIREMYREKMKKVVSAFTGESEFKLIGTGLSARGLYEKRRFQRRPKKFTISGTGLSASGLYEQRLFQRGPKKFTISGTGLSASGLYEQRLFQRGPKKFTNEQAEEALKRFESKE
jgi:hypothetical protein